MTIPNLKKISLIEGRNCSNKTLNDDLSILTLQASKASVKETLWKIKTELHYDTNAKNLSDQEVGKLKDTAEFLGVDTGGIKKEGLIYLILLGIYSKLSYRCS